MAKLPSTPAEGICRATTGAVLRTGTGVGEGVGVGGGPSRVRAAMLAWCVSAGCELPAATAIAPPAQPERPNNTIATAGHRFIPPLHYDSPQLADDQNATSVRASAVGAMSG